MVKTVGEVEDKKKLIEERGKVDKESNDDDSEDEDYNPDEEKTSAETKDGYQKTKEDEESTDDEEEKKILMRKYSVIESGEGGLIKTRSQRMKEVEVKNFQKVINEKPTVDVDSLWQQMNQSGVEENTVKITTSNNEEGHVNAAQENHDEAEKDTIEIIRSYEYAGETIVENKIVPRYSAEAKAYLNSLKLREDKSKKQDMDNNKIHLSAGKINKPVEDSANKPKILIRRRKKKVSIVDSILKGKGLVKINTLEKSRLDWANYVDKNQLSDELKKHNKDGYLTKVDFLNKVEHNVYSKNK